MRALLCFFCLHCIFLFCFNSIWFAFCYVFFKLCYFFFCSAKSTFIHLLELHVWFGFLLLIIIIYHKYVRQYVTGIESQDKLWTEEEIRNDMSSGLPTVFFFFIFQKMFDWVNFVSFFLSYNNVQFICHVRDRLSIKHFHGHLLTTRSIENWKERIENWHAKPTNYFFFHQG